MQQIDDLPMTGERLVTSVVNQNTIEHLHRYALACELIKDKKILDIACGEGYGSMLLAKEASSVIGADISDDAISHAKNKYKKNNLNFIQCSADNISLESNSIDLVVSFETIEHVNNHVVMIAEIKRVLKDEGVLIISSPEKSCNTDLEDYVNPYHVHELYEKEFKDLIKGNFKNYRFLKQRVDLVSIICDSNKNSNLNFYSGDYKEINHSNELIPTIWIAIASDGELSDFDITPLFRSDLVTKETIFTINNTDYYKDLLLSYENLRAFKIAKLIMKPIKLVKNIFEKMLSVL